MRYVDWTYHVPDSFGDYYYMPDVLVEGDSGGPSIFGPGTAEDGQIWAVNSVRGTNQLGAVVALRPQICAAMYAEEPHTWGSLGAPLIVPISGCQSLQSPQDVAINTHEVISAVCAAHANCCDPTGYWDSSCVTAGDQAYNSINFPTGCFAAGTGSNWTFGSIGTTGQQYPADFTVFALGGNVTSNYTEIRGAVAGQGKVTANSFSINFPGLQPVGLVAGGNVELGPGGTIYGNIYYGGPQKSIAPTVAQLPKGTTVTQGSPIRFGDVGPALTTMSQTLSTAPTQIAVVPTYGNLLLSSSSPGLNVFSLHQADLQKTHSITLAVPFSSTVIINVDGTAPTITSAGIKTGGHDPGLILWNFYQATALNVSYCTLMGSVLAPNADAVFRWGVMWGTLVAKSVDSTTEFHQLPFRNNCLVP
jgi:choice-of-anchor A domain-containing protein